MSRVLTGLALAIAILSLALNVFLIGRLNQGRVAALDVIDRASNGLNNLSDAPYQQTFHIDRTVSVQGEFPIRRDMTVPISTTVPVSTTIPINMTVPINTTTNVSVNTGLLGNMTVPVAVNTTVPVNMQVPVKMDMPVNMVVPVTISDTIPYSLSVPINMDVPVSIKLSDFGLTTLIQDLQKEMRSLRAAIQ